jgi:hypothetical protein
LSAPIAAKTFLAFQNFSANNTPSALGVEIELAAGSLAINGVCYGLKAISPEWLNLS